MAVDATGLPNVRRTAYLFVRLEDDYVLNPVALLRGIPPKQGRRARIFAVAVLTGEEHHITGSEWDALRAIPQDRWIAHGQLDPDIIRGLVKKALLLSDADDPVAAGFRRRDEAITATAWHPLAALYHFATQWSGVMVGRDEEGDVAADTSAAVDEFLAQRGPPPSEFAHVDAPHIVSLPDRRRDDAFYQTLLRRRTTRAFDLDAPMSLEDLSTILRYVFGSHGFASPIKNVVCIKRTSASGGGLHPITAYPLISNVEGLTPGVYHYNGRDHSLALLTEMTVTQARDLANSTMCGQTYFADAQVTFVLVARFDRNHWKYQRHPRAYAGILMDAAHLSQTLYLLSAELGLGAFVTIGINGRDIEAHLGLDGVRAGVIAACGCGNRVSDAPSPLEFDFHTVSVG